MAEMWMADDFDAPEELVQSYKLQHLCELAGFEDWEDFCAKVVVPYRPDSEG